MTQDPIENNYDHLDYGRSELRAVMAEHYDRIIDFITGAPFQSVLSEMSALPNADRPSFVQKVLLDDAALRARGIEVPDGILIQRSAFGDRRPTLFAVKHFLPEHYRNVWENVNITFDTLYESGEVSRDRDVCWRPPLDPAAQAQAMSDVLDLRRV